MYTPYQLIREDQVKLVISGKDPCVPLRGASFVVRSRTVGYGVGHIIVLFDRRDAREGGREEGGRERASVSGVCGPRQGYKAPKSFHSAPTRTDHYCYDIVPDLSRNICVDKA